MIVGVGIDVVDISRFSESLARTSRLRDRLFTPKERELSVASLAARFAAKEAFAKALGAPVGLDWQHAEVVRGQDRRPHFRFEGTVAARVAELEITTVHLSLSHDAGIASAVVVCERNP
ncbi:MAG: holo-ACP synthase [Dermatophilaceae bacterium]